MAGMDATALLSLVGGSGGAGVGLPSNVGNLLSRSTDTSTPGGALLMSLGKGGTPEVAAKAAASAAGVGVCTATGVGAAVAPICGAVAGMLVDGVKMITSAINRGKRRARAKVSDLRSQQAELDLALADAIRSLQAAWSAMAPTEKPLSAAQAGDLLKEAGLILVWDTPSDVCSPAAPSAWRVPFFLSLVYQRPSYNRSKAKCQYGDTTPSKWMTNVTSGRAKSEMLNFGASLVPALERASSVLVTVATARASLRAASDTRYREALEKRNREVRLARIRNYAIGAAAVAVTGAGAYFVVRSMKR